MVDCVGIGLRWQLLAPDSSDLLRLERTPSVRAKVVHLSCNEEGSFPDAARVLVFELIPPLNDCGLLTLRTVFLNLMKVFDVHPFLLYSWVLREIPFDLIDYRSN